MCGFEPIAALSKGSWQGGNAYFYSNHRLPDSVGLESEDVHENPRGRSLEGRSSFLSTEADMLFIWRYGICDVPNDQYGACECLPIASATACLRRPASKWSGANR